MVPEGDRSHTARVLALDVGQKRIGLAISDGLGLTAQGLDVLRRTILREDLDRVARIASERKAARILVGLPLHLSGEESPMSAASGISPKNSRKCRGSLSNWWMSG